MDTIIEAENIFFSNDGRKALQETLNYVYKENGKNAAIYYIDKLLSLFVIRKFKQIVISNSLYNIFELKD